tara:strand:- start:40 stop:363 length:324 start_codon:yes stop_codon:yes gene_type:complete
MLGNLDQTNAAAPAVIGDEKEVPHALPYPPPRFVVHIFSPGALKSTVSPPVAQQPKLSFGPVAVTDSTFVKPEGEWKSKFVFPSLPPFPADATTIQPYVLYAVLMTD